jgi:hypothetical protein
MEGGSLLARLQGYKLVCLALVCLALCLRLVTPDFASEVNNMSQAMRAIGTLQRIDDSRREILVRTRNEVVPLKYGPRTVVYDRDRELRVADLRNCDEVSIQLWQRRGI